jgi:hypothetical protein
MQTKTLSLSGKTQDKTSSSEFSNKQPMAENHADLKKFIVFAIEKTVEAVKENKHCTDLSLRVEDKIRQAYGFKGEALARLYNPIFWHLTITEIKCQDGKTKTVREALIPSGQDPTDHNIGAIWQFSNGAEEKIKKEKKEIAEEILEKYMEYLQSNIKLHKVDFSAGSKD